MSVLFFIAEEIVSDEESTDQEMDLEMEPGDAQVETEFEAEEDGQNNPLDFAIPDTVCCDYRAPYKRARRLLYNEKEYEAAYHALVAQVKRGNVPAMFDLGKMYHDNLFAEQDDIKADYLFRHALRDTCS